MADVAILQKAVEKYEKFWPRHLNASLIEALGFRAGLKSVGEEDDMYTFNISKTLKHKKQK